MMEPSPPHVLMQTQATPPEKGLGSSEAVAEDGAGYSRLVVEASTSFGSVGLGGVAESPRPPSTGLGIGIGIGIGLGGLGMPWQRASEPLDDEQFVYQTTHSLGQSVDAPDTTRVPLAQRLPSVQTTLVDSKKTPRLRNQYLSDASSPSSQVSSLALGADYSGFKKKKKHAALPHLPVNNNPNLLNTPTSASFQDYYQRPILQKRLRSSASSSVASSERSYNAMIPPTVTAHVHHPQHLSRSGMIGVGNNPGGYFTSSSSSASTAASYNNLNTHNYTNTRRGLPPLVINERTRLLPSSSSSASSSASTAANRNLEIDAGGRVTVSVSVAGDNMDDMVHVGNGPGNRRIGRRTGVLNKPMTVASFCSSLFLITATLLALFLLLSNPLTPLASPTTKHPWILPTDTFQPIVTNITAASTKIYAFEFELMAINWGLLWDVVLNGADLEVFVEASGDTIAAPSLPPISHAPFPIHTTSQELLAHISLLSTPAIFPPHSATLSARAEIVIEDPSSTVGKIIYMNYPYKLVMKGSFRYTGAFGMYTRSIGVCSVHIVEARDEIISRECGPTYL